MRRLEGFVQCASALSQSPTFYTLRKRRDHKPNYRNYNSEEPYIPYAQLTQEEVLALIYENGVDKVTVEESVGQQLANLENPPVVTLPLPWVTT